MKPRSVIFLHGFPFNSSAWTPQLAHLQGRYDVHAPDLRGHGSGPSDAGPWMLSHFVEDLVAYMDARSISKAVICGLSMGGYIALQFVAKYPTRVAGLVLSDTRADGDSNDAKEKRFETIRKIQSEGLADFAKSFSKTVLSDFTVRNQPEVVSAVETMITGNKVENVVRVLAAIASRHDNRSTLPTVKVPTLVLVGSEDKVTPPELSEMIAGGIPAAELFLIDHAGHLSNVEQPSVFNERLDSFLENHFAAN